MRRRSTALITGFALTVLLAVAPPGALAASQPVLGAADGVQATQSAVAIEVRFTGPSATAVTQYAGKRLTLTCRRATPAGPIFADGQGGSSQRVDADVRGEADGTVSVRAETGDGADVCAVERPYVEKVLSRAGPFQVVRGRPSPLARVALTPAGAVSLDELGQIGRIVDASPAVGGVAGPDKLPAAVAVPGVVALEGPGASPPPGMVGYWSDGALHAAFVALSGAGRRLLSEDLGNGMVRSNVNDLATEYELANGSVEYSYSVAHSDPDPRRVSGTDKAPVFASDGVRARLAATRLTVRFTGHAAAAYRRIAGRHVSLTCAAAAQVDPRSGAYQLVQARVPRHGGSVTFALRAGGGHDVCSVTDDGVTVAGVMPTAAGRAVETDFAALGRLFDVEGLLPDGATAYPSAAALAAKQPKRLVALARPGAPVPAGRVGIWTDGAQQALLAASSATGHRLIMADEGNGILRSNIFGLLTLAIL